MTAISAVISDHPLETSRAQVKAMVAASPHRGDDVVVVGIGSAVLAAQSTDRSASAARVGPFVAAVAGDVDAGIPTDGGTQASALVTEFAQRGEAAIRDMRGAFAAVVDPAG